MHRFTINAALLLQLILLLGCSRNEIPVTPIDPGTLSIGSFVPAGTSKQLWGFFDAVLDTNAGTLEISPNRTVANNINATGFFNNNPSKLKLANLSITQSNPPGSYVNADLDISLQHPFAGVPKFSGYDFILVFIGDGHGMLMHDLSVKYAIDGDDQMMLEDPVNADGGGPDGYTRWYNPDEFLVQGLFGYIPGAIATDGYIGTATINPYKLYADDMTSHEDAYEFVSAESGPGNNVFASGNAPVARNMYLRFPSGSTPLIRYNYALVVSWDGAQYPEPVNTPEVIAADIQVGDGLYYVDPGTNGGDFVLDISLAGYGVQPSVIIVESTVLTAPYTLDSGEMTPVDSGGSTYSTYHVEIDDTDVQGLDGNEAWIIAQYNGADKNLYGYQNPFGVQNMVWDKPLRVFFRIEVPVSDQAPQDPIKNIPLEPGLTARDITVVHSNGDLLVLYNNGQVWKYTEADMYTSGTLLYTTDSIAQFIDANTIGDSIVSGTLGTTAYTRSYFADGTAASQHTNNLGVWSSECWCPTTGTRADYHYVWYDHSGAPDSVCYYWFGSTYGSGGGNYITQGSGISTIHHNYLVGTEPATIVGTADTQPKIYALEGAPEYRVERRNYIFTVYDGVNWGGFGDISPNFNNPKDITRNFENTYFVLDELSTGQPVIKKFTGTGTPLGTYGDSTTISSTPLRIEGSERFYGGSGDNLMFVLHGNPTDGYFLSIFFPSELS